MFGGSMPVIKLPIVPLQAMLDADKIRRECIEQGKLWWRIIGGFHCAYEGIARVAKYEGVAWDRKPVLEETFVSLSALWNSISLFC